MQKTSWIRAGLQTQTIDERYRSVGGFTSGFDYCRLILAAAVVAQHSIVTSYGTQSDSYVWGDWHRIFVAPILLMFFALSGFLVSGSLKKRPTLGSFITLRVLRLVPALAVEVLLSALILGPLLTALPLSEYFTDKKFFAYFGNILGMIRFFLPGVFTANPFPGFVNISLWTVPYELECYLALIALWLARILRRPAWVAAIVLVAVVAGTTFALMNFEPSWANNRPLPRSLIVAFLCGVCLNLFSHRIRLHWRYAALAFAGLLATTVIYQTVYIAAVFSAYLIVYVGMMHPPKKSPLFSGDYSYGLYLFAFPLQQTYSQLFPEHRHWYFNILVTLFFGMAYAAFSWWVIEKPVLSRKKQVVAWVDTWGLRLRSRWEAGFSRFRL
ncbi:acyltransferase family protein [Xylophilus rhododendri]|uniref:Acyltransferase family protein n=1 Tax=Xylophilus rhododendri TaxID=2697032 RepID=A0A857IZV3_9BURK|nr:acyltransferase [Xylophilus rhododendri]QHI96563.1 acyltransferase family protein [Xylophilus rhododendri]